MTATLLLSCDDAIGIIATVTGFVNDHGGIICSSETHRDEEQGKFFQRLDFSIDHFDLDRETIIEQDVTRVSHRDSVTTLVRRGKDLERVVLARAVQAHLEHRVLVVENRAIVFG